jgi:hypothetical protein
MSASNEKVNSRREILQNLAIRVNLNYREGRNSVAGIKNGLLSGVKKAPKADRAG